MMLSAYRFNAQCSVPVFSSGWALRAYPMAELFGGMVPWPPIHKPYRFGVATPFWESYLY